MCQTSKLLCWFLSPPPPPPPPSPLEYGVTQQSFFQWGGGGGGGGGGGSAPRSPPLTLLYTALDGKIRPSGRTPPGLNLCLGARDVLCAVSGFGLLPKLCRPLADTLPAALVKNPLVPRVSQECPLYSSAKNAEECFKNY